jgi:transposase
VGHDVAGENLAALYSLIATCEVNGVNPVEYIADVLMRVQSHPASRIDELLPHNWTAETPAVGLSRSAANPKSKTTSQHCG